MSELQKVDTNKTMIEAQQQQIEQMNEVAKLAMTNIDSDRDRSNELYDFMKDQIDIDGDRNPATREAMAKAVELRMKGTDQLIELLKIKAKLINPNAPGVNVNINLGGYDEAKGGDTNDLIDVVESLRKDKKKETVNSFRQVDKEDSDE
jgi:hypothetical protein